jgi:hypothetical protein
VKGTPESGKMRLVKSRKIAKEKMKIAMLWEGSSDPLKDDVERLWGVQQFGGG